MTTTCRRCNGEGETECYHCNQSRNCPDCNGEGKTECSIADWKIPQKHKKLDKLFQLKNDAMKCESDHAKLIKLNPRAKESYDSQLAASLLKIEEQLKEILK